MPRHAAHHPPLPAPPIDVSRGRYRGSLLLILTLGGALLGARPCQAGSPSSEKDLAHLLREALGDTWRVSRRQGDLIVERRDRPEIVNKNSADPHEAKRIARLPEAERRAAIARRFRVKASYRIVVREGAKLDEAEVRRRLRANQAISRALEELEREGVHRFKPTPESDARIQAIWETAREIPCGAHQDHSIYLYITNLRAADTDASVYADYDAAVARIVRRLSPYRSVRLRKLDRESRPARSKEGGDTCAYNEVAPLKPIACPW